MAKFFLKDKIISVIGNLTVEEIDKVTMPDLNELTPYQQLAYIQTAIHMGRKYFIGLKTSEDYDVTRYGTFSKFLMRDTDDAWELHDSAGLIPGKYIHLPPLLTKEVFIEQMSKRYADNQDVTSLLTQL
ncbi:hypothetical protein KC717_05475 [Candidatus Dojkabacteria bacterium]|uniref:Uncharacterized protein n=1 Tax=Candidatus Dojkabacteria bacterium TaxID=2099670 RepID=A0A955L933_9BACT|nr:hypothetical protein [Candidatus Dojkabacteria bacterium]